MFTDVCQESNPDIHRHTPLGRSFRMTTTLMARSDPTKSQFPSISEPPSRDSDAIAIYLAALAQHLTPYYTLPTAGGSSGVGPLASARMRANHWSMTCRCTPAVLRSSYVYLACFTPVNWPPCCSLFGENLVSV